MNEDEAISTAETLISLIIQHQPSLFGTAALSTPDKAKSVAHSVAALRSELIQQLIQQK